MSYLFFIDSDNNAVLHPDVVKLSPELGVLSEEEILFIILVYDYHSIYRQWNEEDRIRKAMVHVWNDNNPKIMQSSKIQRAIEAYKALQYNPKVEQVKRYQMKIDQMIDTIEAETSVTAIKNARDIVSGLRKDILELENEISEQARKAGKVKGDRELSWLETIMENKAYYEKIIAKK
jgi:hypothetical protein